MVFCTLYPEMRIHIKTVPTNSHVHATSSTS